MSKFRKNADSDYNDDYQEIDLLKLLKAFWRRAWLIAIAAVICGAAGFTYARMFIKPTYQSSARMYVNNGSFSLGSATFSVGDFAASKNLVETYIVLIKTRMVLNDVIASVKADAEANPDSPDYKNLKLSDLTYGSLVGKVTAASVNDTEIFDIIVTDNDATRAKLIANKIAEVLPERVDEIMKQSSMRVIDEAQKGSRTSPNVTKYATLGITIGIIAACAIIVVLELLDDRIHDEQYLIQNYNLPVLASIPNYVSGGRFGGYYSKKRGYGYRYKYGYRSYRSYYAKASSDYAQAAANNESTNEGNK